PSMSRRGNCYDNAVAEAFSRPSVGSCWNVSNGRRARPHEPLSLSTLRSGITDNVVTQLWAIKVLGTLNNGCTAQPKLLVYKTEASALCSLCLCGCCISTFY